MIMMMMMMMMMIIIIIIMRMMMIIIIIIIIIIVIIIIIIMSVFTDRTIPANRPDIIFLNRKGNYCLLIETSHLTTKCYEKIK